MDWGFKGTSRLPCDYVNLGRWHRFTWEEVLSYEQTLVISLCKENKV